MKLPKLISELDLYVNGEQLPESLQNFVDGLHARKQDILDAWEYGEQQLLKLDEKS